MTKKNYYAVASGRLTGVFQTWDECQAQVNGFHGAKFKKFNNIDDAKDFITKNLESASLTTSSESTKVDEKIDYDTLIKEDLDNNCVVAFVDGSFSDKGGESLAGYGCYIVPPNKTHIEISDKVHGRKFISTRNIAPEIFGALEAIKWAVANEYQAINIYHDLEHTGKWARGEFSAKTDIAKFFVKELQEKYTQIINIKFTWVKGHAGIAYNEQADRLASQAIQNQRQPVGRNGPNFFTGKNVSKDKVDAIIEEIKQSQDVTYSQGNLNDSAITHTFRRSKDGIQQEKLTVTFFPNDCTTLVQGKVESLFAEFLSLYTLHIPAFEMIRAYSDSYKASIKATDIDSKILLLNLPENYPQSAITLLKQSYVILDIDKQEYDYTHYTIPAYRALEGHLKYLCEESKIHVAERQPSIGSFFNKNATGSYSLTHAVLKASNYASKIESAYNLYNNNRHAPSHFGEIFTSPIDTTLLINDIQEAKNRIIEVLDEIKF